MVLHIALVIPLLLGGCALQQTPPPAHPPAPAPVVEAPAAAQLPPQAPVPDASPVPPLPPRARRTASLDIWMMNVGQGTCTYVQCPDPSAALVIDCGTSTPSIANPEALAEWLNDKLTNASTATLLVSHADKDHLAMLKEPLRANLFDAVLLGGVARDYSDDFLGWAEAAGSKPQYFTAGEHRPSDSRFVCPGARVDLLTVNASRLPDSGTPKSRKNADSAVVKVSYGEQSAVLTGDAEGVTELSALANAASDGVRLDDITLLTASHHGSGNDSNLPEWIAALRFKAAVFSSKVAGSFHHPHCPVLERLEAAARDQVAPFSLECGVNKSAPVQSMATRSRLLSTSTNGTIHARFFKTKAVYRCERMTPACDEQLEEDELP